MTVKTMEITEFDGNNYHNLIKELELAIKPYRPNGVWLKNKKDKLAAFNIIMDNISFKIAETVPTENEDPEALLDYLNATFGETLIDAEERFKMYVMDGIDPDLFISELEDLEETVEFAGGSISPKQWFKVLTRNIHIGFYQGFYRETRMEYGTVQVTAEHVSKIKPKLKSWYHNTHPDIQSQYQK